MIFEEKKIELKNGLEAILKTPEIEDAEILQTQRRQVSEFNLYAEIFITG